MYFNLGIGPAVNKEIAKFSREENYLEEKKIAHTGFFLNLLISVILGFFLVFFSNYLYTIIFDDSLNTEILNSTKKLFFYISIGSSVYLLISYFRNTFEGRQSFLFVSIFRSIFSSFILIAPLLTDPSTIEYAGIYILLLLFLICIIYLFFFSKRYHFPNLKFYSNILQKKILKEGILMSMHSFVNPIFIYLDRYLIGVLLSLYLVGIYTSFYDLISRLTIIATSVAKFYFLLLHFFQMINIS